jgi:hypothetical protein
MWIKWIFTDFRHAAFVEKWLNACKINAFENFQTICYVNKEIHIVLFFKKWKTMWIVWITYWPNSLSPTFTISPAPMVINKSPVEQFSKINVSISSKVEK